VLFVFFKFCCFKIKLKHCVVMYSVELNIYLNPVWVYCLQLILLVGTTLLCFILLVYVFLSITQPADFTDNWFFFYSLFVIFNAIYHYYVLISRRTVNQPAFLGSPALTSLLRRRLTASSHKPAVRDNSTIRSTGLLVSVVRRQFLFSRRTRNHDLRNASLLPN